MTKSKDRENILIARRAFKAIFNIVKHKSISEHKRGELLYLSIRGERALLETRR